MKTKNGKKNKTKAELQLENKVLHNILLCIQKEVKEHIDGRVDIFRTIGSIDYLSNSFENRMEDAKLIGYTIDYRKDRTNEQN